MTQKIISVRDWFIIVMFVLTGSLLFSGCKDEDPVIYDFSVSTDDFINSYLTCTHSFFYVDGMLKSLEDSLDVNPTGTFFWKGIQVTVQPVSPFIYPKTFSLNFDATPPDSLIQGTINGSVTSSYNTEGSAVEFTFEDCTFNHGRPSGTCFISNMGMLSGKMLFEFQITDGTLIRNFGTDTASTVLIEGSQDVLWAAGTNELTIPESIITGLASDSLQFTAIVNMDYHLIKDPDCSYIRDGIFDYTVKNKNGDAIGEGIVDFGYANPAECDFYILIVIDGEVSRSEFIYLMDWIPD